MKELNPIQMKILKHLLFNPKSREKDLNLVDVPTKTFEGHLKEVVGLKYIYKYNEDYRLTVEGKEFANTMDTQSHKI